MGLGEAIFVEIGKLVPNAWNPNVQSDFIYEKELASIRKFGFVDPLIVSEFGYDQFLIIDGYHRYKAGAELGYTELPCWNLGIVDEADAREMTVVLNETRGEPNQDRLRELIQDLIARRGSDQPVRDIMPFSRERFDEIIGRRSIDWGALEERREQLQQETGERRWKELIYRMPIDAAKVVEDAIDKVREEEGFEHAWQALEMICADAQA